MKIKETFENLKMRVVSMQPPATLDGGDVLFTGKDIFVGLSRRTNEEGIRQLSAAFPLYKTYPISVTEGLHLKSFMSAFERDILVVGDCPAGRRAVDEIKRKVCSEDVNRYDFVFLPDVVAANILRIGDTVVVQENCPRSVAIIRELANKRNINVITVDQSELWKVDGALTCCSILFNS
jgi:dimethylargininase